MTAKMGIMVTNRSVHIVTATSGGSKGGHEGRAPPGVQILSISCSFWENLANSYVGAPPPGELAPPPRGNPGSATGNGIEKYL